MDHKTAHGPRSHTPALDDWKGNSGFRDHAGLDVNGILIHLLAQDFSSSPLELFQIPLSECRPQGAPAVRPTDPGQPGGHPCVLPSAPLAVDVGPEVPTRGHTDPGGAPVNCA